jgi:hypothetical protein
MAKLKSLAQLKDELDRGELKVTVWSGYPDPRDPDNYWIDDETGERRKAPNGERVS